jgi:hypothetical protein
MSEREGSEMAVALQVRCQATLPDGRAEPEPASRREAPAPELGGPQRQPPPDFGFGFGCRAADGRDLSADSVSG